MRIALLGTVPGLGEGIRPELHAALPQGTVLSAWPSRAGVFPSTPVERDMQAVGHLEAGLRAAGSGVDAVVIDSVGDYGLEALRAALGIPAVGSGEAGMRAAAHGRFAIITVWPASMNFVAKSLLRAFGLEGRCIGIRNVGAEQVIGRVAGPDGYLAGVHRADPEIMSAVVAAIDAAVTDGAEVIPARLYLHVAYGRKVAAAVSVPVINPLGEAVKRAVAMVAEATPSRDRILSTRGPLLTRMIDAVAGEVDEHCPVCIVG